MIIAKGKTTCLNKYKINENKMMGSYSNNAWMDE